MGKQYVTAEQLEKLGWHNVTKEMIADLNNTLEQYYITTPERIRHFFSQCSKESERGIYTSEQNFGDPNYFKTKEYGEKYRGAGYIQMTWAENYEAFANEVNDSEVVNQGADYVAKNYPWRAAGFWWKNNHMNDLIDTGASVEKVTKRVTGGIGVEVGQKEREKYYEKASAIGIGDVAATYDEFNVKDVLTNISQVQIKKSEDPNFYRVQDGDTLSGIAAKRGISEESILKANPQISNRNRIKADDDVLYIPSKQVDDKFPKSPGLGDLQLFDQQNMKNITYLDQQQFSFEDEFDMMGPPTNITLQIGQWSYSTEPITGTD
jgi:predicted chitinase